MIRPRIITRFIAYIEDKASLIKFSTIGIILLSSTNLCMANPIPDSLSCTDSLVKYWKLQGSGNINLSQGYLSNWVQGGESSIASLWVLNIKGKYKKKRIQWDSQITWKYGLQKPGVETFRKNEDLINFNSKLGYKSSNNWFYSGIVGFKSQFFNGFDYPNDSIVISGLMSPAYLQASFGMDYKPNDNFTLLLSPISSKTTIIGDTALVDQQRYGVDENRMTKQELGAFIATTIDIDIAKNIRISNKLELFTSYLNNPQNIDVDWEMNIVLKATKYISTQISTHLIYDDDIEIPQFEQINGVKTQTGVTKKIQFKELLSIGLSYKF